MQRRERVVKMATKRTEQGQESQDLGSVAERTFLDLVLIWLDGTGANKPARLEPDSQKIDFVVNLPSLRQGMSSIRTLWQIKSSVKSLKTYTQPELASECFHLAFPPKYINSLKESLSPNDHFYLAFAHNKINAKPSELLQRIPEERFDWYIIDLHQQFTQGTQENYLVIPV